MKKGLLVLLSLVIAVLFAACSNTEVSKNQTTSSPETETITETTTQMVDESLIDVEFTVPASFFVEDDPPSEELSEEQKAQGIKKATINEDGSVTYTLSKKAFRELKQTIETEVTNGLNTMNEDYPCIKNVEFNKDFSQIDLYVDKDEYEGVLNVFAVYQAGLYGEMYQAYTGTPIDELSVDVNVINYDTGETIESAHYPLEE